MAATLRSPFVLFGISIVVWMAAWAGANPPGAAPDEPSHVVKAIATGRGELLGRPVPLAELVASRAFDADQLRQVSRASRAFTIPGRLAMVTGPPCTAFEGTSAACLAMPVDVPPTSHPSVIVGAYPPWLYAPGGVLAWFAPSTSWAYRLVRGGSVLVCGLLLAMALALVDRGRARRGVTLAGVAVAVTPMVVFLGSEAGTSGAEATGGLAAVAAALRLSRPAPPSRRVWWLAGAALALAALARPLAPVWTVLAVAVALGRLGPRACWYRLRSGGSGAAGAGALVAASVVASVAWTQAAGLRTPVLVSRLGDGFAAAWRAAPGNVRGSVGVFGWQDTAMPRAGYWAWYVLVAALVLTALAVGRRRDRLLLVGGMLAVAGLYELIAATVFEQNGFGMQARYILPALVMLPPLAAEIVADHLDRGGGHRFGRVVSGGAAGVVAVAAVLQFVAFAANARRYAVGTHGPWSFLDRAQWSPAGGWVAWLLAAGLALACGLAAAVVTAAPAAPPGDDSSTGRVRLAASAPATGVTAAFPQGPRPDRQRLPARDRPDTV